MIVVVISHGFIVVYEITSFLRVLVFKVMFLLIVIDRNCFQKEYVNTGILSIGYISIS